MYPPSEMSHAPQIKNCKNWRTASLSLSITEAWLVFPAVYGFYDFAEPEEKILSFFGAVMTVHHDLVKISDVVSAGRNHFIDYSPFGQAAEILVVNVDVGVDFAGCSVFQDFVGVVTVYGEKIKSALPAILNCFSE
jgi:hypothetical protein